MIIDTAVGRFEILKDYRDAFVKELFVSKYVDVAFDRYTYIVGDMSSTILRLKGFSQDPKGANSYKKIPDYLNESCNHNCPYFVLKRLKKGNDDIIIEPVEEQENE